MLIAKKYRVLGKIGEGGFGTVYKGNYVKTGETVAIKMESATACAKLLKHETTVLKYLQEHGCDCIPVVHWYGVDAIQTYLVMTYYDCSLYEYIESNREPADANATSKCDNIMRGCVRILESIHHCYVIHRDIKPQNFMLKSGELYLIDFGFSIFYIDSERKHITGSRDTLVGSPRYASYYVHEGCVSSRRDDLISVGYMYLWMTPFRNEDKNQMPWDTIENRGVEVKQCIESGEGKDCIDCIMITNHKNQMRKEMKSWQPLGENCMQINQRIWNFLNYCYSLEYDTEPNYRLLTELWD